MATLKAITPVDPTREHFHDNEEKILQEEILKRKLDETVQTLHQLDDLILQYESAIQTTNSRLLEMKALDDHDNNNQAESSLDELWQMLQRQTTALELANSIFTSSPSTHAQRSPPPIRIKQLLQVANLEQKFPAASQLNKAFHLAIQELHQYIKKNNNNMDTTTTTTDDWKALAEFFRNFEYPNYYDASAENQEAALLDESSISSSLSLEKHLQMAQEKILQQFLAQQHPRPRRIQDDEDDTTEKGIQDKDGPELNVVTEKEEESVPLSFPETWQTIRSILEDAIVNRTTAVAAAASLADASSSSSQFVSSPDCLQSPNQVVAWIEAGIEAIHNQKDIRQAILHALEEDEYDISRIILDADL
jgi:hypothetical protein